MKTVFILSLSSFLLAACYENISREAEIIHEKILTVDTHTDTPLRLMEGDYNLRERNDPSGIEGKIDFPRMKEGGLDAIFWAVFVWQGARTDEANKRATEEALDIITKIKEEVNNNSDLVELAVSPSDAYNLNRKGKRAVYIGMENGYPVESDINLVHKFYDLGVRYITLCHSSNNDICDSSTDPKGPEHNGLSEFGKRVVKEMNRLGMIIDVSHMSDKSFFDVISLSKVPVVATHSCTRSLCDQPRNMTDDMIKKLAEKGGVIQVTLVSSFIKTMESNPVRDSIFSELHKKFGNIDSLSDDEKRKARVEWMKLENKYPRKLATVSDFVDHIDHVVNLVGVDYVGIGSDFDGGGALKDCFDVSEIKNITVELLKRGYSEEDIRKIWGGNFMRIFKEVEERTKLKIN